jgi:hypothetical protein
MTTQWFTPTITTQTAEFEEHVQWQAGYINSVDAYGRTQTTPNTDLSNTTGVIQSIRPLVYIANDGHAPRREHTWYITFTGFNSEEKIHLKTQELITWMKQKGLEPKGEPQLARYNPPWSIPFLRRNEVMLDY